MAVVIVFILTLGLSSSCLQRPANPGSVAKAGESQKDRTEQAQVKEKRAAAVVLDELLTPGYNAPVWVYARSGKVESHRLRIWPDFS